MALPTGMERQPSLKQQIDSWRRYDREVTAALWRDPLKAMKKENLGYSLVAAELWLIPVALAASCGAVWWLDQNQQEPMPGGTGGLGGQPAETVSDHLEGIFITEDENFALIEKSFDIYTQENGNSHWSSNRSAFGFFIEGRVSADGKPNTLFPYVIADDGQRVAVFAWGGDSDFTELQLVREEGKVRWEETDGDVHFSAETHLAGGYLVYLTPEGKEVRVELPRGGKLAALINVEVEALQPIEPAFQASWTPTGELVLTMTTEPEKTASAMPPTEIEPTPLPSATPKPPTAIPATREPTRLPQPTLRPTDIILSSPTAPAPDTGGHFGLPEESWPYIYFDQGTGKWVVQMCITIPDGTRHNGFTFVEYANGPPTQDNNGVWHDRSSYNDSGTYYDDYGPCP